MKHTRLALGSSMFSTYARRHLSEGPELCLKAATAREHEHLGDHLPHPAPGSCQLRDRAPRLRS
jgi:hypothetical protein